MIKIKIRYFAILRELRAVDEEDLDTDATTPSQVYSELAERHGLDLDPKALRVAVNDEFCDWDCELKDGDALVFIPPVAGG